jgi:hypothetical protein
LTSHKLWAASQDGRIDEESEKEMEVDLRSCEMEEEVLTSVLGLEKRRLSASSASPHVQKEAQNRAFGWKAANSWAFRRKE